MASIAAIILNHANRQLEPDAVELKGLGMQLLLTDTVQSVGLCEGDTIYADIEMSFAKPVIHVFSPKPLEASVTLSLVPDWTFSAIYPVVPITPLPPSAGQLISWTVHTQSDGSLKEINTGLDVAYLFWEAHAVPTPLSPSPAPHPVNGTALTEVLRPISCNLNDCDSVLLPVNTMTPYLDKALEALGLHVEARTSFITHWLPSFLKHKNIALRFVPQSAYEKAAPLDISPLPDVVTRIFMLFKGVTEDEVSDWPIAQKKASSDVVLWRTVVDVDIDRATDSGLLRVLEWGGMEVLRA